MGVAIAAWWTWWHRYRPFRAAVEGTSMLPGLEPGDFLVAVRLRPGSLRPGRLVVVEHPSLPGFEMVKRLAGTPGHQVGDGRVLGELEYWVLGDAPDSSIDSRAFGPVEEEAIRGVVVARYWPPGRAGPVGGRPDR
jgi:nickel-type superoxide dismutase maturation protease